VLKSRREAMAYTILLTLIRLLLPLQARVTAFHTERCPRTGPLIIVANHLGLLDPLIVATRVPRRMRILAKAEVFQWFALGGLARIGGIVPVRRGASDREALQALARVLADGDCVLLTPEGTYPKMPLPPAMLRAKTGAAFLAVRSGAPVLPVGVTGAERLWAPKRGWRLWHRPRVTVTFGEPYTPVVPQGVSTKEAYQAVADEMGRRIAVLLPAAYRGYYGDAVREAGLPSGLANQQTIRQDADLEA
jgi:1-acyl-sn-glycerol-3-phosphate acyltransferase